MTQVSRRHLLAGAAGAAAVYGAATAHAATTSDLNICAAPKFDESFDLVVIGSGGAGLSSAVMAWGPTCQSGTRSRYDGKLLRSHSMA